MRLRNILSTVIRPVHSRIIPKINIHSILVNNNTSHNSGLSQPHNAESKLCSYKCIPLTLAILYVRRQGPKIHTTHNTEIKSGKVAEIHMGLQHAVLLPSRTSPHTIPQKHCGGGESRGTATCPKTVVGGKQATACCL